MSGECFSLIEPGSQFLAGLFTGAAGTLAFLAWCILYYGKLRR